MSVLSYLKTVLIAQLFYAFIITMFVYAIPPEALDDLHTFRAPANEFNEKYIAEEIEGNLTRQTTLPVIELATLVFYSGNIVLDLLLNFATAVPQMLTLLIGTFFLFFRVDAVLANALTQFFFIMFSMIYLLAVVSFLLNIRSQGTVV